MVSSVGLRRETDAARGLRKACAAALDDAVQPLHRLGPRVIGEHPRPSGLGEASALGLVYHQLQHRLGAVCTTPGDEQMLAGNRVDASRRDLARDNGYAHRPVSYT